MIFRLYLIVCSVVRHQKCHIIFLKIIHQQVEQETVTAEEFAMMLIEYNVQTVPYEVYSEDTKVTELPYNVKSLPNYIKDVPVPFFATDSVDKMVSDKVSKAESVEV